MADVVDPLMGGYEPEVDDDTFLGVLRETVAAVEAADIDYLLMGGISSTVHGRERWTHDIDLFVRTVDARRVLDALSDKGFDTEETFPDWLFKGFKHDVLVDVIFRSSGGVRVDDEMLDRADVRDIRGVKARIIPPEDLLVIKAVVHDEHLPRHWHDALGLVAHCPLDWDYLLRRARAHGARRTLALLVYAQSNDLIVPERVIGELFDAIYRS